MGELVVWESTLGNADQLSAQKKWVSVVPGDDLVKLTFMQLIMRLRFNVGSVSEESERLCKA